MLTLVAPTNECCPATAAAATENKLEEIRSRRHYANSTTIPDPLAGSGAINLNNFFPNQEEEQQQWEEGELLANQVPSAPRFHHRMVHDKGNKFNRSVQIRQAPQTLLLAPPPDQQSSAANAMQQQLARNPAAAAAAAAYALAQEDKRAANKLNAELCKDFSVGQQWESGGSFSSPNFPHPYPVNLVCTRLIEGKSSGDHSSERLHALHLERRDSGQCLCRSSPLGACLPAARLALLHSES